MWDLPSYPWLRSLPASSCHFSIAVLRTSCIAEPNLQWCQLILWCSTVTKRSNESQLYLQTHKRIQKNLPWSHFARHNCKLIFFRHILCSICQYQINGLWRTLKASSASPLLMANRALFTFSAMNSCMNKPKRLKILFWLVDKTKSWFLDCSANALLASDLSTIWAVSKVLKFPNIQFLASNRLSCFVIDLPGSWVFSWMEGPASQQKSKV